MTTSQIAASHAKRVSTQQLQAFVDQLAAREPKAGSADHIRLETYCAALRARS